MAQVGGYEMQDHAESLVGIGSFVPLPVSKSHTPIYKQHRYFARRPHNQFRAILEHLTAPASVVLDCFSGGGVTLVEGLTLDRRVISIDVNPIACMVQLGQVADPDFEIVSKLVDAMVEALPAFSKEWYTAECRACHASANVRWFEHAYVVRCPHCAGSTDLRNDHKATNAAGRQQAGKYACSRCGTVFRSVDTPREGSTLLSLRVKCGACGAQESRGPEAADLERVSDVGRDEQRLVVDYGLRIPYVDIPMDWDRQAEDALARKGFKQFADLFTPRNRLTLGFLFRELSTVRPDLSQDEYAAVLIVLSSLIRYANNMTISTSQWMDGRPVAWAKHAYWTPNQYVECNPFEYLQHRLTAARKAQADRRGRFVGKLRSESAQAVVDGVADYAILRTDARRIPLGDGSVQAVVTDPPFGSNVQYGELTELWSVWLGDLNPFHDNQQNIADEILVHRKKRPGQKSIADYEIGLTAVFSECNRVLSDDGVLAFTFNNKDPKAWCAVMGAALSAGFSLAREDISYQPEIAVYRDTAHLRFDGELQGDVLYVFRKSKGVQPDPPADIDVWRSRREAESARCWGTSDWPALRLEIHLEAILNAARFLQLHLPDRAEGWLIAARQLTTGRKAAR